MAITPVQSLKLVVPLGHKPTAMRTTDTAGSSRAASGAVSPLIGASLRSSDLDSTMGTPLTPGIRTSTTVTRTTTTRALPSAPARSAVQAERHHADFSFEELVQAYLDCRKSKRNTPSALAFEIDQERNLARLADELRDGSYRPGRSICFVVTRPKAREVWAAEFRDRIVHHLFHNRIAPRFYRSFITDSCACIPGRGTLYAAQRLEAKIRSATENWQRPAYFLKLDLANFFVSIDKHVLWEQLAARIPEPWWRDLAATIVFHDPRTDYELRGRSDLFNRVPHHKRLTSHADHLGLPIGNLSSQFFANVYLNDLDQFIKHRLGARHYIRYVDDFILIHQSAQWLNASRERIEAFLTERLHVRINPRKTILQPVERGVDFAGQLIKPWCRRIRRRIVNTAIQRIGEIPADDLFASGNSYFGLFRHTDGHQDRARLANALRRRGRSIKADLTKTYQPQSPRLQTTRSQHDATITGA